MRYAVIIRPRTFALVSLALSSTLAFAQYPGALPPPEGFKQGFFAIDTELAKRHLNYLAGPECEGRGTGQPGYLAAANYVAQQFREMGLLPVSADGSYFQGVPFFETAPDQAACFFKTADFTVKIGSGLAITRSSGDFSLKSSDLMFLNISPTVDTLPDDLVLEGKIVFVTAKEFTNRTSSMISRKRPALTVLLQDNEGKSVTSFQRAATQPGRANSARGPVITLARRYGMSLAQNMGVDANYLTPGHANGAGHEWVAATGEIMINLASKVKEVFVPNVVGMITGTDPLLKAQYIGVGAHLDHLGVQNGIVFPGADDDGSGSTAMLLVAKAVMANSAKPKRTIVFMAFCGEEMGLIGSKYYTDNPLIPLEQMDCLLQMDMVGRNEEKKDDLPAENVNTIHLIGSKRISTQLHDVTIDANQYINFVFEYDEEGVYTRSDHANFAAKGVPITFVFSGFHPDYHQPTDTIDKINFEKIVSSARLNYLVLQRVSSMPEMVKRDVVIKQ